MRSFLYIDKVGIVERIFKRNGWSKYDVFMKNTQRNFAVTQSPDDQTTVIFKDNQGNIFLTVYSHTEPVTHQLYSNTDNDDIYFDAFADEDYIHIFYTMLNRRTRAKTIFYQKVDREFKISSIDIIGRTNYDYEFPFVIYNSGNGNIYIVYQRCKEGIHHLGYKVLDMEQKMWTKYQRIDESSEPFTDFSLLEVRGKTTIIYIKKEDDADKVMCFDDSNFEKTFCEIYEGNNIDTCSIFTREDKVWCTWIVKNRLYGSFRLLNESIFSSPPYEEVIKPEITNKGFYLSNFQGDDGLFPKGEFYVFNNSGPSYHGLPKLYDIRNGNKNVEESFDGYISEQVLKKMQRYVDELKEKDRIIEELREMVARLEQIERKKRMLPRYRGRIRKRNEKKLYDSHITCDAEEIDGSEEIS